MSQGNCRRACARLTNVSFALALVLGAGAARAAEAPESDAKPVVVFVPPFENTARTGFATGSPRGLTEASRGVLEDILVNKSVKVVERERSDKILTETMKKRYDSTDDKNEAAGKALGADLLVMGTVLSIDHDTQRFQGNKVRTSKLTTTGKVRVRVVELKSGAIVFSEVFEGKDVSETTTAGGNSSRDGDAKAIAKAVGLAAASDKFVALLSGGKTKAEAAGGAAAAAKVIEVSFEPTPTNCDILIDGEYRGGSPLKLSLTAGKPVKVTIRKAGRRPWETTLSPSDAVRKVSPELDAEPADAKRPGK